MHKWQSASSAPGFAVSVTKNVRYFMEREREKKSCHSNKIQSLSLNQKELEREMELNRPVQTFALADRCFYQRRIKKECLMRPIHIENH